jgi:hypothetical protein
MNPNPLPPLPEAPVESSVVDPTVKLLVVKTKEQLKTLASKLLPNRRFRVMTKKTDARSQGHDVALLEEVGTNGQLVFVTGGPNLSMVGNFLKAKVDSGELK